MSESASADLTTTDNKLNQRMAWRTPTLSVLGDLGSMTETGSGTTMEVEFAGNCYPNPGYSPGGVGSMQSMC